MSGKLEKNAFVQEFFHRTGKHAEDFYKAKDWSGFCKLLNQDPELIRLFDEAVEAAKPSGEDAAAAGLGALFPDN